MLYVIRNDCFNTKLKPITMYNVFILKACDDGLKSQIPKPTDIFPCFFHLELYDKISFFLFNMVLQRFIVYLKKKKVKSGRFCSGRHSNLLSTILWKFYLFFTTMLFACWIGSTLLQYLIKVNKYTHIPRPTENCALSSIFWRALSSYCPPT